MWPVSVSSSNINIVHVVFIACLCIEEKILTPANCSCLWVNIILLRVSSFSGVNKQVPHTFSYFSLNKNLVRMVLSVCVERCQRFGSFSQKSPPSFFGFLPVRKGRGRAACARTRHSKTRTRSLMDIYVVAHTHTHTHRPTRKSINVMRSFLVI